MGPTALTCDNWGEPHSEQFKERRERKGNGNRDEKKTTITKMYRQLIKLSALGEDSQVMEYLRVDLVQLQAYLLFFWLTVNMPQGIPLYE